MSEPYDDPVTMNQGQLMSMLQALEQLTNGLCATYEAGRQSQEAGDDLKAVCQIGVTAMEQSRSILQGMKSLQATLQQIREDSGIPGAEDDDA